MDVTDVDLTLEGAPGDARLARRWARAEMLREGRADLVEDVELALSELVTNATLHGEPPVRIRLRGHRDRLRLEVYDGSASEPTSLSPRPAETIGRGLSIVAAISANWGWSPSGSGKVVWCELPAAGPAAGAGKPPMAVAPIARKAAAGGRRPHQPGHRERTPARQKLWTARIPDVPVELFRNYLAHNDEQWRELQLAVLRRLPPGLAGLGEQAREFTNRRRIRAALWAQAVAAEQAGCERTDLEVKLSLAAVDAGEQYLAALDQIDSYCRAEQLLALETPPVQRCFRRWLINELSAAVRRAAGQPAPAPCRFETVLVQELEAATSGPSLVARVLESAPDAIVGVDRSGRIRLVNRQTELLFGYERMELLGQPVEMLIPQSARGLHERHRQDYFAAPGTRPMGAGLELFGQRRDGSQFPVDVSLSSINTEQGLLVSAAVRDLTAVRQIRERLRETHRIAETLQRSLLDPVPGQVAGLAVATRYRPAGSGATVGGDWHDVFPLPGGAVGVTVGDVGGHGVEAAAIMARLRTALAAVAEDEPQPGVVLAKVNRLLCRYADRSAVRTAGARPAAADASRHQPDRADLLATALYGWLDPRRREFQYAVAGHPGPLLIETGSGRARLDDPPPNLPLGLDPGLDFEDHRLPLPPSGTLVLFTDGLYERRDTGLDTALGRIVAQARRLAGLPVDRVADTLLAGAPPAAPQWSDDLALVVIGW